MRFRDVVLVVVLILAGFVFFQFKTGQWRFDGDWAWFDDWNWGFDGREVIAEDTRTFEAPLPPAIEIANGHGRVEVRGGDQDFAQMTFRKVVWRRDPEEAKSVAAQVKYTATATADTLTLSTNREEFRRKSFETAFILTVPRSMVVRVSNGYGPVQIERVKEAAVRNRHGQVHVAGIDGPCVLETSHEDVEAREIMGSCRIVNSHADVRAFLVGGDLSVETSYGRVRVEDAGGRADLRARNSDVEARRVTGAVTVETSYEKVLLDDVGPAKVTGHNMAVAAQNVRGGLEVRTSHQPVRAAGVRGDLLIDARNAAVTARDIDGPAISVETSYENVVLDDFSGDVSVVCRNGDVHLGPRDLRGGMNVRGEHGRIVLLWPSGGTARLEARSRGGSIIWGLAGDPDVNETNGVAVLKAFAASTAAPLIYLSTSYDDIRIDEAGRRF